MAPVRDVVFTGYICAFDAAVLSYDRAASLITANTGESFIHRVVIGFRPAPPPKVSLFKNRLICTKACKGRRVLFILFPKILCCKGVRTKIRTNTGSQFIENG